MGDLSRMTSPEVELTSCPELTETVPRCVVLANFTYLESTIKPPPYPLPLLTHTNLKASAPNIRLPENFELQLMQTGRPAASVERILGIPEMLREITQYFDKRALGRTAIVCTALHNASIERLWSGLALPIDDDETEDKVDALRLLRGLLPSNLTSTDVRPTSDNMWCRFKHYSVHVKAIRVSQENYWPALFSVPMDHRSELFPRLQNLSITWGAAIDNLGLEWLNFFGPQLKSFHIHRWMRPTSLVQCLHALDSICRHISTKTPDLEELLCDDVPFDRAVPMVPSEQGTSICASIRSLNKLRNFSWQSRTRISNETLQALAELPQLSQLSLNTPGPFQATSQADTRFPSLRRLSLCLSGEDSHDIPTASTADSGSWLKELSNPQLLTHLVLGSSPLPMPFRTLNLVVVELTRKSSIKWSRIFPLLSCRLMRVCKINTFGSLEGFKDSSLSKMALSWRDLEELSPDGMYCQGITILGLAPLAASCPKLRCLQLTLTMELKHKYGSSWRQEYHRVLEESYPSGSLEQLCIVAEPPQSDLEFGQGDLGTVGVARLILRLWSSFNPDNLSDDGSDGTPPFNMVRAAMRGMKSRDRDLREMGEGKERELDELRKERDRIQEDNEQLRLQLSELGK